MYPFKTQVQVLLSRFKFRLSTLSVFGLYQFLATAFSKFQLAHNFEPACHQDRIERNRFPRNRFPLHHLFGQNWFFLVILSGFEYRFLIQNFKSKNTYANVQRLNLVIAEWKIWIQDHGACMQDSNKILSWIHLGSLESAWRLFVVLAWKLFAGMYSRNMRIFTHKNTYAWLNDHRWVWQRQRHRWVQGRYYPRDTDEFDEEGWTNSLAVFVQHIRLLQ